MEVDAARRAALSVETLRTPSPPCVQFPRRAARPSRRRPSPGRSLRPRIARETHQSYGRSLFAGLRFRKLPHHLVEVEARGLLPDREFLEALQPLRDDGLCRYDDETSGHEVAPVISSRLRPALERVGAEVVQVRNAETLEPLSPNVQARVVLLDEGDLPLVDAHGEQIAVIVPVEELVSG